MPTRPRQHQLEDKSRTAFQASLPEQWVWRDKDKDYGIDGEVELFDSKGNATGLVFLVQLKATASSVRATQRKISLKRETISYYNRLPSPVMVVRWVEEANEIFFRWSGRILTARERTGTSKSLAVRFDDTNRWREESPALVERQLIVDRLLQFQLETPLPILLRPAPAKVGSIDGSHSVGQIRARIGIGDLALAVRRDFARSVIEVVLTKDLILIYAGTKRLASFGGLAEIDRTVQERHGGELVIMTIGFALFEIGQVTAAAEILRKLKREVLVLTIRGAVYSAVALTAGGYPQDALAIPRVLHDSNHGENVAQLVVIAIQKYIADNNDSDASEAVEGYIRENIDRFSGLDNQYHVATQRYNLGNFLRSQGRFRESLSEYRRALRAWADYETRAYFWEEVAGVLFLLGRFRRSAAAYRKSLGLDDKPTVHGRTADALMCAGKYADAVKEFEAYFQAVEIPSDEWVLKQFLVETLVEKFDIEIQSRKISETEHKAGSEITDSESWKTADEMAYLSLDALNPTGWQIISEKANALGDADNRAMGDLASAIVADRENKRLWIRALMSCFVSTSAIGATPHLVRYAYWLFGQSFLAELFELLSTFVEPAQLVHLEKFCDDALKQGETSPPDDLQGGFVVRMPDIDGKWRELTGPA